MVACSAFSQFRAERPEFFAKLELIIQLQACASRWEIELIETLNLRDDGWSDSSRNDFDEYLESLSARQRWA